MLISSALKVWLSASPTDMRKAIDGLCFLVAEHMNLRPNSGELFVFYNKQGSKLKILYWDRTGFCLWYKRLEKHKFTIPKNQDQRQITSTQLRWLLDGLDFMAMKETQNVAPTIFF